MMEEKLDQAIENLNNINDVISILHGRDFKAITETIIILKEIKEMIKE